MLNSEFLVWLDGFHQVVDPQFIDRRRLFIIKNHLRLSEMVENGLNEHLQKIFDWLVRSERTDSERIATEELWSYVPPTRPLHGVVELAYWVQGALEIGGCTCFNLDQCRIIANKANMMDEAGELTFFIIRHMGLIVLFPQKDWLYFGAVVRYLQNLFVHDIDPSYQGDQDLLGKIHRGQA